VHRDHACAPSRWSTPDVGGDYQLQTLALDSDPQVFGCGAGGGAGPMAGLVLVVLVRRRRCADTRRRSR